MNEGVVTRIEPRTWTVFAGGREIACSLKPRVFDAKPRNEKNPVAVGDRVRFKEEGGRGVIEEVLPRRNRLARPTPSDPSVLQVTAANVDLLVIVAATENPPLRPGLVDRFLVTAERHDMEPLIVVNKCDEGDRAALDARLAVYPPLGYAVLFASALRGDGVDALQSALAGKTALFVGHSGVGKTSLVNRLLPDLALRTGGVAKHGRGKHTTTSVSLWPLPGGGFVVDSPGIRGFGLFDIPESELAILMPDLRPHATDCRYPDCTHSHEPDCGVRAAVERGDVLRERYESYLRMLEGMSEEE